MHSSFRPPRKQCCPECGHTFPTKMGVTAADKEQRRINVLYQEGLKKCGYPVPPDPPPKRILRDDVEPGWLWNKLKLIFKW